ncbi:radical SAM/SPASM domain-containing protein [Paenibacillus caui]|uniref:radical SAM/SPASM domain-containing protein n=1 Tax=Paenibacillus caui TaxID=2873927 RepID=UPI001CA876C2|nr:radical SAM protein [Paenibacillus caui]
MWKLSQYNYFIEYSKNDSWLAYNTRTSALAILDKDKYEMFKRFEDNRNTELLDNKFLEDLNYGGFIIQDNINELDLIKARLLPTRYSTESLGLTIATTMNCNLGCIYCYEKNNKTQKNMSMEVQEKILSLVKSKIKTLKGMSIYWYGGEPLLGIDIIRHISQEVIAQCEENEVNYSAGIVTNGYFLNRSIAEELKKYKIERVQVTLDGPDYIHDVRRPLIGGQPSFEKIINNIVEVSDLFRIAIRINTDATNQTAVDEVLGVIKEKNLKDKVSIYLANVHDANGCYNTNTCLTTENFTKLSYEFDKRAHEQGYNTNFHRLPIPIGSYCTADTYNSYVIDPEGYIYSCWHDVGNPEKSYSNLINKQFQGNSKLNLDYLNYEPYNDEYCKNCKLLPSCMGGCPSARITNTGDRCSEMKFILEKKIIDYATSIIENKMSNV